MPEDWTAGDRRAGLRGGSQLEAHVDVALLRLAGFELLPAAFDLGVVRCQGGFDPRGKAPDLVLRARTARKMPAVGLGVVEDTAAAVEGAKGAVAPFAVAARSSVTWAPLLAAIAACSSRCRIEAAAADRARSRKRSAALRFSRVASSRTASLSGGGRGKTVSAETETEVSNCSPMASERRHLLRRRSLQRFDQRLAVVDQQHHVVAGAGELHVEHRLVGDSPALGIQDSDGPITGDALGRMHGGRVGVVQMVKLRVVARHDDLAAVHCAYRDVHPADGQYLPHVRR